MDRIDFEEFMLKSLDPSLGPSLRVNDMDKIPLIYPPSICTTPVPNLRALVQKRTPIHRRGFISWLAITPLTAPLKLIRVYF